MAAVARLYSSRTDPLHPLSQASHAGPGFGKGKGASAHYQVDDGLAISYDQYDRPSYRPDGGNGHVHFQQNEAPVSRNKPGTVFLSAYDSHNDRSNRIESVFDVYADMYAEDEEEHDDEGEDAVEELQRGTSGRGLRQEDRTSYEPRSQPTEPWDERGKTGLYGGGGRGADDRETGWVSDYAFAPVPPISGYEEDLRFDGDEGDEVGPRSRLGSRGTQGSRRGGDDEYRRESSETAPSSKGPTTPPDADAYPSAGSPPRQTRRVSAPLSPPIHTIDAARIKKNMTSPRMPTPSAPMPAASVPAVHVTGVHDRPTRPRTKTGRFKWGVRAKKAPTISAPILPEGFVESLGMETFPLYPGVQPPQHAVASPALRQSQIPATPSRDVASPNPQQRSPPTRKAAPRPKNAPGRADTASPPHGGERATSPSPPPLRVGGLRDDGDTASEGYPEEVFRRLSKESAGSSVPADGSAKVSSRKYFDSMRQEHGRPHEEQQANRGVFSHSSLGPVRPARRGGSPGAGQSSPLPFARSPSPAQHQRSASSATAGGGFRDPWSAGSRTSMHSQRTHTGGNRNSYFQGSERTSLASTVHEYDYRKGATPSAGNNARQYSPAPVEVTPASPLARATEDRHGSFSSAYSEVSEVPPPNDFHPSNAFRPGFTPSNTAGQLRKNSLAGGLPTLASFAAAGGAPSGPKSTASFVPIQPLNLGRRPSHAYRPAPADDPNRNTLAGDVVWGGIGAGGPRDVASPVPSGRASPFVAHAPTIGTTGFRNPFG
ncbi:hypothetical protein JCM10450v2_003918 [Rhodotorula kratochvilovae]